MRPTVLGVVVVAFVVSARPGVAQVYVQETPPPAVTAASAAWQVNGEPIFHSGNLYYPSGPTVFFDGRVMVRTGQYNGVPVYADVTLEPYSIVYVPVGGAVMRPYERRRQGELAGTVGSRTPGFPVQRDVELSAETGTVGLITPAVSGLESEYRPEQRYVLVPVSTLGHSEREAAPVEQPFTAAGVMMIGPGASQPGGTSTAYGNTALAQRPSPPNQTGVWIDFGGGRWFSAGPSVHYDASRFEPAGDYRGFPVYRERGTAGTRIFVTVVHDGPLAPFERR
jgi:hypothetical protein